jgi:hypothetical protein
MKTLFARLVSATIILVSASTLAFAQSTPTNDLGKFTLLTGLQQPILLRGANIGGMYITENNIVFEASFGFNLNYPTTGNNADFSSVVSPFTGGFGVGYHWNGFVAAIEPKASTFRLTPKGGSSFEYVTYTLGVGLYYNWYVWKGLVVQPTLKYWPRIASSLPNDKYGYTNSEGQSISHTALTPGFGNSGLIAGVSIGWTFGRE